METEDDEYEEYSHAELWLNWCVENEANFPFPIKHKWYSEDIEFRSRTAYLQLDGLDPRVRFSCEDGGGGIFLELELKPGHWAKMGNGFDTRKHFKGIGWYHLGLDRNGNYYGAWQFSKDALLNEFPVWLNEVKELTHPDVAAYWMKAEDQDGSYISVNVLKYPPPILCGIKGKEIGSFAVLSAARGQIDERVENRICRVPNAYALEPINQRASKFVLSPGYVGALPNRKGITFLLACGTLRRVFTDGTAAKVQDADSLT